MIEHSDLDFLLLKVKNDISKELITEAITAYRAGALRSAILSTYIAVTHDIISKVRKLADVGDPEAKKLNKDIEGQINKNEINIEKIIGDKDNEAKIKALNFLPSYEFEEFKRLREVRNLCAHLSLNPERELYQPLPESVRSYITHALKKLLITAPLQGKVLIDRFFKDVLNNEFLPVEDFQELKSYIDSKFLKRANSTTIKNLMYQILQRPFCDDICLNKISTLSGILNVIKHSKANIYENKIKNFIIELCNRLNINQLLYICCFMENDKEIWNYMEEAEKIQVKNMIESHEDLEYLIRTSAINISTICPELENSLLNRINKIDAQYDKIDFLRKIKEPAKKIRRLAISIYSTSRSYREAEEIGLSLIAPMSQHFESSDVESLLNVVLENRQIYEAHWTWESLKNVFEGTRKLLRFTKIYWESFYGKLPEYRHPDFAWLKNEF